MDTTLSDPLVGQVVDGRYRVDSRVARGGMATVYLALDRRLDREVALKVMLPQLAEDAEFVGRFVREARAAARLSHPNVVQVFDQGSDGRVLYLAMEYLPGRTLRDVLAERGAFTVRESLTVLEPVLDALGAAHRAGIVHRDVKPENVILTDDGRVKVADFGLAKAATTAAATTGDGLVLGTAAYLAPEVLTRGIADARADVYSAGILLFEMLTGSQPFAGGDVAAIARRHVTDVVPQPSSLVPYLPAELDDLVSRATDSDPDERPANAEQLLSLVRALRQALPESVLDIRPRVQPVAPAPGGRTEVVSAQPHTRQTSGAQPFRDHPSEASQLGPTVVAGAVVQHQTRAMPMLHRDEPLPVPVVPGPPRSLQQSRRRRRGRIALVVVLALVAVLGSVAWWFTGGPGAYTKAPAVVGQPAAQAVVLLRAAGLGADQKPTYDDRIKVGVVISADPQGGERVRKGGTVTLAVSRGPQLFAVPAVVGKKQDAATALLQKASLTVGEVAKQYDDKVASGLVISASPAAGKKLRRGESVDLVVSRGAHPVQLQDFTGQPQDQAVAALTALGLKKEIIPQPNNQVPPGQVLSQGPAPGSTVRVGDKVTLVVSAAPALVTVPDVVQKQFDEARKILEAAGFQVQRQGTDFTGTVFVQMPAGGEQAAPATVVVLTTA